MAKDNEWTRKDTQDYSEKHYGSRDSAREVSRADHQAKNDYQDSGSPFGELSDRDRSEKSDTHSSSSDSSDSGGGMCYIATATLTAHGDPSQLALLRDWRDEVLERSRPGRSLSTLYREIAPDIARDIRSASALSRGYFSVFVRPGVWFCKRRKELTVVADAALFIIFVSGLAIGLIHRVILRLFPRRHAV